MPERDEQGKHYSEKGSHFERGRYWRMYASLKRNFPDSHFRALPAPTSIQNDQSSWVRRIRQPRY